MTTWRPARRRLAAIAVLTSVLTGAAGAALGLSDSHAYLAGAYVAITVVALFHPAAITGQVIGGQLLAGSVLLGQDGLARLWLVPVVASVVATAELLAIVARLDTPLEPDVGDDLRRAEHAAVIGGGVFGAVVLLGGLPGPTGLAAIALAAGACVALAILLARSAR